MIVGGLDSVMGTIVAGLLLGTLEVMTAGYITRYSNWGKNLHTDAIPRHDHCLDD